MDGRPQTMPIIPVNYTNWQRWQCDHCKKTITVCNRYDADRDLDLQVERFIGANDSPFTLQFRDVDKYLRDLLLLYRL